MAVEITAQEQLLIELLNRARLDPLGEAARYGIDLNQDLPAGTLDGKPMQVLAPNALLNAAADGHSQWMLDNDTFSHTGANGSTPYDRIIAAGYTFDPGYSWAYGENVAYTGSTAATIDTTAAILAHHKDLFLSHEHRLNILSPIVREVGIGQDVGPFTISGTTYTSSMVTEDFALSGPEHYLTGVAYNDRDADGFYSVGEGISGIRIAAQGSGTGTLAAGGYALGLTPGAAVPVTITSGALTAQVTVDLSVGNVKLDLVNGDTLLTSGNLTLGTGINDAALLGVVDANLTGNADSNTLTGNAGNNHLFGGGGFDTIDAGAGNDTVNGGNGRDKVFLGLGNDLFQDNSQIGVVGQDTVLGGAGNDTIQGGGGNDLFDGQAGNDKIYGRLGNDHILGGDGNDTIDSGVGNDTVDGGRGRDLVYLGSGADLYVDNAQGGILGQDTVWGGTGNDTIRGVAGNDIFHGLADNDLIGGGLGNDQLFGEAGADRLLGGGGNDTLNGGAGNDRLTGGAGADQFVFTKGDGKDHITDFDVSVDTLSFTSALTGGETNAATVIADHAAVTADGVVFTFADGTMITLDGLTTTTGLADHLLIG